MSESPTENLNETNSVADTQDTSSKDVNTGSSAVNEGASADSPPADKAEKGSLVDRIKAAVDGKAEEKSPISDEGKKADAVKPEGENAEDDATFTKDDLNNLHSKTRVRVRNLLNNVETLTKEKNDLLKTVEAEKQYADQYRGILSFAKSANLTMDDLNLTIGLARDYKNEPQKALTQLRALVSELQKATGEALPEDLAAQVKSGHITEAHAQELSRHRANANRQVTQSQEAEEAAKREREETARKVHDTVTTTAAKWESDWKASDPDYQKKRDEVLDEVELAIQRAAKAGKLPQNAQAAIELLNGAKKKVEERLSKYAPPKTPMNLVTGSSAVKTHTKPASLSGAILQSVNG